MKRWSSISAPSALKPNKTAPAGRMPGPVAAGRARRSSRHCRNHVLGDGGLYLKGIYHRGHDHVGLDHFIQLGERFALIAFGVCLGVPQREMAELLRFGVVLEADDVHEPRLPFQDGNDLLMHLLHEFKLLLQLQVAFQHACEHLKALLCYGIRTPYSARRGAGKRRLRQMFTLLVRYRKAKSWGARKERLQTKKLCRRCQIGRSAALIEPTSDAIARPGMRRASRRFRRSDGRRADFHRLAQWQPHPHAGSFMQLALCAYAAAVSFDNGLGDGQPQAEATGFAGTRAVAAPEALENIGQVLR